MARNTPPDVEVRHIGHCIYCSNDGSTEKLTREHIIPLSFSGYRYLGEASCRECRDLTHAIEGQCCRTMFKALRIHHGIRTRRPKQRPTHLDIIVGVIPHDAPFEKIPVERAPGFAPFPIFDSPQILTSEYSFDRVGWQGCVVYATTDDAVTRQRNLVAEGRPGALAHAQIPIGPFLRTLAKVAHCYVVSQVGLSGFRPLLQGIIRGKGHPSYYIGGMGPLPLFVPNPGPDADPAPLVDKGTFSGNSPNDILSSQNRWHTGLPISRWRFHEYRFERRDRDFPRSPAVGPNCPEVRLRPRRSPTGSDRAQLCPHQRMGCPGNAFGDRFLIRSGDPLCKCDHPLHGGQVCLPVCLWLDCLLDDNGCSVRLMVCLDLGADCPGEPLPDSHTFPLCRGNRRISLLRSDALYRPGFHPVEYLCPVLNI
jgi:hypothetical protein